MKSQTIKNILKLLLISATILFTANCANKINVYKNPFSTYVHGKIILERKGKQRFLNEGTIINDGDILKIPSHSNMIITFLNENFIYISENSNIRIEYIKQHKITTFNVNLNSGKLTVFQKSFGENVFPIAISTNNSAVVGKKSCFEITYQPYYNATSIKNFSGKSVLMLNNNHKIYLKKCNKILIPNTNKIEKLLPISSKDVNRLIKTIGKSQANQIPGLLSCVAEQEKNTDLPPQWNKEPKYKCSLHSIFTDTLTATDSEKETIQYSIIKAPKNLTINSHTGVIKFKPSSPNTFEIRIRATNSKGLYSDLRYYLTVTKKVTAILKIPMLEKTNNPFVIDASYSTNEFGKRNGLKYRFDINNDQLWDIPTNGNFGNKSKFNYTFDKEGTFLIALQVKDKYGNKDTAKSSIIIDNPPTAVINATPPKGKIGTLFTFDATKSTDTHDSINKLLVRWGFDDSLFNNKDFNSDKIINYMWNEKGKYKVFLQVMDSRGNINTTSITINVTKPVETQDTVKNTPDITQKKIKKIKYGILAPESTLTKDTVHMFCIIPKGNTVKKYKWDLYGKSEFPISVKQKELTFNYSIPGNYIITCNVILKNKAPLRYTKRITVYQHEKGKGSPPTAYAGKNIISRKGKKVKLYGKGSDPDGKILKYEWDLDGDGAYDKSNDDTGYLEYRFDYYTKAVLRVTDYDRMTATDTVSIIICPPTMSLSTADSTCVDKYEWPNIKGYKPKLGMTYAEAVSACDNMNKHLCTSKEWINACRSGNPLQSYPYGKRFNPEACNTLSSRLGKNKIAESGTFVNCHNDYNIFDMSGNTSEWTAISSNKVSLYGGWWQSDKTQATCSSYITADSSKTYPFAGFRCCK